MSLERPDVELAVPAEPESVALARHMVRGIIDRLGWSDESRTWSVEPLGDGAEVLRLSIGAGARAPS